jgi:Secretion system C-terminal sorting domain
MKKIYQLLLLVSVISTAKSQTFTPPAFADVDNNYRTYVNQVFGALESNRITTGLLANYGFDFTDPKIYNGSVLVDSTLMEQGIYSELYKTIFTSKFNSNAGTLVHPSIYDSLCYVARQKEVITLSGLLFKYNAIDPNAQANGKMQTINGQLKDKYVSGVWQNPYQEFNTMAISPSTINYNLTYCSVVLPSNLFLTNRSSEISTIQFDAADGQGYRTIQYNTPVSLNYADTGWKRWIFKITLTTGQQLFSHCKIHFSNTSNVAGSGGAAARGVPDRRRTITATEAFNGVFGVADIVISYRNANDLVLRRPLIVAEGFDPGWITSPEEPEGENTFNGFIRSVGFSGSGQLTNLIGNPFNPNAPSEYDVVYVNWRNGTDWLQRNELVLEAVIRWVNANKQPLGGVMQPNVVLGSSMGGVIARMALGRMDRGGGQNGAGGFAAHQTNLYVSLDAPHQGANVPLGYQAAARHATRMYVSTGGLVSAVEIIQLLSNGPSPLLNLLLADQPASRQMLTNRIDINYNQTNATNQQFLQDLRTQWAYPVNIRNIAISNGSECAIDQEFAAGSSLLYHYRSTKTRFIGDLIFMVAGVGLQALNVSTLITIPLILPGSSKFELTIDIKSIANGGGNAVYYGNIKLTKKILWLVPVSVNIANKTYNAPSGILPFDTYPGGFYTLTLANQPGSVSQDWMFSYNNSFFIQRRFSFIPTTSSLDIGQGNTALINANYLARYIGATPPVAPFNTPFANFATAFNQDGSQWIFDNSNFRRLNNEPHEGLFIRNANFLANEMNGINNLRTNCEAFCANGTITGNTTICTNQTLTAPFGNGVTYNWTVANTSLVTLTPNGNTVLVTRNGTANGQTTITVNISGACGNIDLTATINVGTAITGYYTINSNYHQPLQRQLFTNNSPIWLPANQYFGVTAVITGANLTSNIWNRDASSYPFTWSTSGTTLNFSGNAGTTPYTQRNGIFTFTAQNVCGTATQNFLWPVIVSSGSFRVAASPNPVSSNLNIAFSEQTDEESSSKQQGQELRPLRSIKSTGRTIVTLFEFNTSMQVRQWTQNETSSKGYNYSVAGLRKGLYILQVDRNNQTATTKIIVE